MTRKTLPLMITACTALSGCNMAPHYSRPASGFAPPDWPQGAAYGEARAGPAGLAWRDLISYPKLQAVIGRALERNQDLAAAVANVAAAQAQYRVQRSDLLPTVSAGLSASYQRAGGGAPTTSPGKIGALNGASAFYSGNIGISGFEIDLFGRKRNLSQAAFQQYLATASGARSTRFAIVAETATAYATLASDQDLLVLARQQVKRGERSVGLTQQLHDNGLVSGSDMSDATTVLAQAKADVEAYTARVAQDRNALEILVGGPVEDSLLPEPLDRLDPAISVVPAGLSSEVLFDRPDVVEAEQQLKGAYANIGAARAAFFPTISLTGTLGVMSTALSGLFKSGADTWSVNPAVSMPLIGGPNAGNVAYARAQADYYLATYQKTAQTAYREVADGLARQGTIARQRSAQRDLVNAGTRSANIAMARYREGTDNFLNVLVAQRALYAAQQAQAALIGEDIANRIALYRAIGSDASL